VKLIIGSKKINGRQKLIKVDKVKSRLFIELSNYHKKMKLIIIALVVQCTDFIVASKIFRERESNNVLVPNNDANIHAKIKSLLHSDDIELSDNDLLKYPFIKRILHLDNYYDETHVNQMDTKVPPYEIVQEPPSKLILPTPPPPPTTSTTPIPNPSANEECIFGVPNQNIKWVDENGNLKVEYILKNNEMKNLKIVDHSYVFADFNYDFRLFLKDTYNMLLFKVSKIK
jgi:hypothetical protein